MDHLISVRKSEVAVCAWFSCGIHFPFLQAGRQATTHPSGLGPGGSFIIILCLMLTADTTVIRPIFFARKAVYLVRMVNTKMRGYTLCPAGDSVWMGLGVTPIQVTSSSCTLRPWKDPCFDFEGTCRICFIVSGDGMNGL